MTNETLRETAARFIEYQRPAARGPMPEIYQALKELYPDKSQSAIQSAMYGARRAWLKGARRRQSYFDLWIAVMNDCPSAAVYWCFVAWWQVCAVRNYDGDPVSCPWTDIGGEG